MPDNDETFLARWSRRKRGGEPTTPVAEPVDDAATIETGDETIGRSATDKDAMLTEADFVDVNFEALDFGSDYTRFMGKNVPDAIRNRALRKLWVSDPVLANMDGLHDYFGDYTDEAVAIKPGQILQTAYKFGQGFLSDDEAAEWDKLGKPEVVADAAEMNDEEGEITTAMPTDVSDKSAQAIEVATIDPTLVEADPSDAPDLSLPPIADERSIRKA